MAKFKVGDKVRVREDLVVDRIYGRYSFSKFMEKYKGEIFTIEATDVDDDSYYLEEAGYYWTDDMLEKVNKYEIEKTFREVIADIKEGEVWEKPGNRIERIFINEQGNIQFEGDETFSVNYSTCVNPDTLYKLQRKEYTFVEAFKAFEKGEEIESVISRIKYKKYDKDVSMFKTEEKEEFSGINNDNAIFSINEIRGKWHIND